MNIDNEVEVVGLAAKCIDCQEVFHYPSFGEFAYGKFIFTSDCGQYYRYFSVNNPVTKLIEVLLSDQCGAEVFQATLAAMADPVAGHFFQIYTKCPTCSSCRLQPWGEHPVSKIVLKAAEYSELLALPRNSLIQKVRNFELSIKGE